MPMESRGKDHLSPTSQSRPDPKGHISPIPTAPSQLCNFETLQCAAKSCLVHWNLGDWNQPDSKARLSWEKQNVRPQAEEIAKKEKYGICRPSEGSHFAISNKGEIANYPQYLQSLVWSLDFPSFQYLERFASSNLLVFSFCLFWSALIFCLRT